jgi:hypothetical protein
LTFTSLLANGTLRQQFSSSDVGHSRRFDYLTATAGAPSRMMLKGKSAPGRTLEPIIGFANKSPEHAARLAAVLTLVEDPTAAEITPEIMARGIVLAQHYMSEALRLFQGAKVDRDLRLAIQLLDWLVSWGDPNVSLPDIYQSGPNAIRDRKTALPIVRILEAHRNLVKLPGSTLVKGERRRDAWLIVPEDRP